MGQAPEELRADIASRREHMTETIDAIGDRVSPSRIAQRRVDLAKGWMGGVRERVMGSPGISSSPVSSSHAVVDSMKEGTEHLAESVGDLPASLGRQTRGNPLVAGGLAFGVGALIASMLPETRPEHAAVDRMAPQLQAATDALREAGQDTLETVKDSAQESAHELKDLATEKAQSVKEEAGHAAAAVKEQATSPSSPSS